MNRNANSHFAVAPANLDIGRSKFDRSHSLVTTFDTGRLIPLYWDEVLPGDTWKVKTSKVIRMQTLMHPIFSNVYFDTYYFFVPNRLIWRHWKQFMGENTESAWIPDVEYSKPQITAPIGGWLNNSLADYLGLPTGVPYLKTDALPFRAYAKIVNDWFISEALDDPPVEFDGDADIQGKCVTDENIVQQNLNISYGMAPFVVTKFKDYFTAALPSPQRGPSVSIGASTSVQLPVVTSEDTYNVTGHSALKFGRLDGSSVSGRHVLNYGVDESYNGVFVGSSSNSNTGWPVAPNNLYADFTNTSFGIDVRDMRTAFQLQKYFERQARSGSRYTEYIKSFFGVDSPDARIQRSEYLGGNRIPININQVIQQSATTEDSPQGNVAAMSVTVDTHADFTKSFTEHGIIMCLGVVRYKHSYQQGVSRMWSRKTKFDYYSPIFANLSEQSIRNKEIVALSELNGVNPTNEETFGYQEAWAEYRYHPDMITGEMRSTYGQSLDSWHLADDYSALPSLSSSWIREDANTVNRVLAVSNNLSHQFFGDFYFNCDVIRPMPLYSIPGLIDHH